MSMASIETMGTLTKDTNNVKRNFINTNLISLKCLLFIFFGGMGCLFPFLSLHMLAIGLSIEEVRLISVMSPLVAIIGPLIVAPLADKLAAHQGSKLSNGRYLRVMIAIVCFLSAVFYSLLLLVPVVKRIELPHEHRPTLKFSCNRDGATVLQERINEFSPCYNWTSESRVCAILLRNCDYSCHPIISRMHRRLPTKNKLKKLNDLVLKSDTEIHQIDYDENSGVVSPFNKNFNHDEVEWRIKKSQKFKHKQYVMTESIQLPHLCFNDNANRICHVYTNNSGTLPLNASFREAINARQKQEWCNYPITEDIKCHIPRGMEFEMAKFNQSCSVECEILDPFMFPVDGVQAENQCSQVAGNPYMTFWMYVIIRSIADIFPTAAVVLLDAAIVIATRETSCGRGDVGRQLAFGSFGFAIFGPMADYLNILNSIQGTAYLLPIILHVILMILASIVTLSANGMPLTPPEWWWHTCSGMVAIPMSAVKRYGSETIMLVLVLFLLGTFWSAVNSYLPMYSSNLMGNSLTISVIFTNGAVPAFFFLWKSENLVDYCGHNNLLIVAFTMYIVRFIGLILVLHPWWALIFESIELFTFGIMWVTAILYFRHLIPRHLTATAQALPVIAHFCIGRCLGAVIVACAHDNKSDINSTKTIYYYMAIAAAITAIVYFILYHGILKPQCHIQTILNSKVDNGEGRGRAPSVIQGLNENNYVPLRVYHNGMGRKGQFRY